MIFLNDKLIYIKIPKTGSTSIALSLLGNYGTDITNRGPYENGIVNINRIYRPHMRFYGWHATFSELASYVKDINDYRVFTVLRDPVDRVHSVYKWQKHKDKDNPLLRTFDIFVENYRNKNERIGRQAYLHLLPQSYWIEGALAHPMMKFFRIEDIDMNLGKFEEFSGFKFMPTHENRAKINEPLQMSIETSNFINNFYSKDIKLFRRLFK